MKRTAGILFLLIILCVSISAIAEDRLPDDFSYILRSEYIDHGGEIISASVCGSSGAAVIQQNNQCLLSVLSYHDGQWSIAFENEHAACAQTSVYLDTDDVLILTDPFQCSETYHEQYYFTLDGEWCLSSVINYVDGEDEGYLLEYTASFDKGQLCSWIYLTDMEGNFLSSHPGMTLPDVLTIDEKLLSAFDGVEPPINGMGYYTDDGGNTSYVIIQRLFSVIVPDEYTFVDGIKADNSLQFVADKADGNRVLLCCAYGGSIVGWQITESTPLPAGTTIGIENFTETLNLSGQYYGVNIGRYPTGTWGVTGISDQHGNWMDVGPGWVSEVMYNGPFLFGDHPWSDITQMDWSSIPSDTSAISVYLDTSCRATPNNPKANDRLHLRQFAKKNSKSLGKYYNGAPLVILSQEGDWTQVRVGGQVGYMMTKYLLTGSAVNQQASAILKKTNVHPLTEIRWDNESIPDIWTGSELQRLFVIGVIEDEWYLVWDPVTGRSGRIRQNDLWDGNG